MSIVKKCDFSPTVVTRFCTHRAPLRQHTQLGDKKFDRHFCQVLYELGFKKPFDLALFFLEFLSFSCLFFILFFYWFFWWGFEKKSSAPLFFIQIIRGSFLLVKGILKIYLSYLKNLDAFSLVFFKAQLSEKLRWFKWDLIISATTQWFLGLRDIMTGRQLTDWQ